MEKNFAKTHSENYHEVYELKENFNFSQELDFGTILCWGSNTVGQQREPCVFHLIAAGKPESPYNCSLVNQTSESLEVDCNEGLYTLFFDVIKNRFLIKYNFLFYCSLCLIFSLSAHTFFAMLRICASQ
jgi:hypothetical protein